MKGEAEEPTGHLLALTPLVFKLGKFCESMRKYDAFIVKQPAVLPPDPPPRKPPEKYYINLAL